MSLCGLGGCCSRDSWGFGTFLGPQLGIPKASIRASDGFNLPHAAESFTVSDPEVHRAGLTAYVGCGSWLGTGQAARC